MIRSLGDGGVATRPNVHVDSKVAVYRCTLVTAGNDARPETARELQYGVCVLHVLCLILWNNSLYVMIRSFGDGGIATRLNVPHNDNV